MFTCLLQFVLLIISMRNSDTKNMLSLRNVSQMISDFNQKVTFTKYKPSNLWCPKFGPLPINMIVSLSCNYYHELICSCIIDVNILKKHQICNFRVSFLRSKSGFYQQKIFSSASCNVGDVFSDKSMEVELPAPFWGVMTGRWNNQQTNQLTN